MMRYLSRTLWVASRIWARISRGVNHLRICADAVLDDGVTTLESARVVNIFGERERIRVGAHSVLGGELLTFAHGGNIRIGEWCFIGEGTRIWSADSVSIGSRVLISHGVNIHDCDSHPLDAAERHEHFRRLRTAGHPRETHSIASAPVRIEDDAWIGFNATILKGVTIGARSIVAAGSIVTRDVPADSIQIGGSVVRRS